MSRIETRLRNLVLEVDRSVTASNDTQCANVRIRYVYTLIYTCKNGEELKVIGSQRSIIINTHYLHKYCCLVARNSRAVPHAARDKRRHCAERAHSLDLCSSAPQPRIWKLHLLRFMCDGRDASPAPRDPGTAPRRCSHAAAGTLEDVALLYHAQTRLPSARNDHWL